MDPNTVMKKIKANVKIPQPKALDLTQWLAAQRNINPVGRNRG